MVQVVRPRRPFGSQNPSAWATEPTRQSWEQVPTPTNLYTLSECISATSAIRSVLLGCFFYFISYHARHAPSYLAGWVRARRQPGSIPSALVLHTYTWLLGPFLVLRSHRLEFMQVFLHNICTQCTNTCSLGEQSGQSSNSLPGHKC